MEVSLVRQYAVASIVVYSSLCSSLQLSLEVGDRGCLSENSTLDGDEGVVRLPCLLLELHRQSVERLQDERGQGGRIQLAEVVVTFVGILHRLAELYHLAEVAIHAV